MIKDLAATRASSSSSPATIPALDFSVFNTDFQQPWPTQPPLSTASATKEQTPQQHSFTQDFQLFDAESESHLVLPQQTRGQAISSIAPNRSIPQRHLSLNRLSTTATSPSIGHIPTSHNYRSYSSPSLQQQQLQHQQRLRQQVRLQQLPPVPIFHQTQTNQRRINSAPVLPQGKHPRSIESKSSNLTQSSGDMASAFDNMFLPGGDSVTAQDDFLNFDTNFTSSDFTAVNGMFSDNAGTVSPHDIMIDELGVLSAPPSTAFPNLSTPESGYLESPAMASSGLNTSPLEDGILDGSLDFGELEGMPPLFPRNSFDQFAHHMPIDKLHVNTSFSSINSRPSSTASPMSRQKSSPGRPPTASLHARKHSQTSGIVKPTTTKSRKPLPEILIDSEDDKDTVKKKKNTAAARKSRQRKMETAERADAEIQRLRSIIYRLGADPDAELGDE